MSAAAVSLFARSEMRRRRLGLLALSLFVAGASAFVLTAATGARRVGTAWSRFGSATRAPNVVATPIPPEQLDATAAELRAQPGVEGVSAVGWIPLRPEQFDEPDMGGFTAVLPGFGAGV